MFKLDELRFSGHGDPLAALVLCGAHRADRVMVGGKWAVIDGAIPGLDVADLIREPQRRRARDAGGVKKRWAAAASLFCEGQERKPGHARSAALPGS